MIRRAAVSVCLGLAGVLPAAAVGHVAAAPAAASECPAEEVCVWSGAGYSGTVTVIQDEACDTAPVGSAMENDGDTLQELRVYPQPGCAGTAVVVRAGQSAPNLSGKSYQNWHDPRAAP